MKLNPDQFKRLISYWHRKGYEIKRIVAGKLFLEKIK